MVSEDSQEFGWPPMIHCVSGKILPVIVAAIVDSDLSASEEADEVLESPIGWTHPAPPRRMVGLASQAWSSGSERWGS
jgi:hypothetical protein